MSQPTPPVDPAGQPGMPLSGYQPGPTNLPLATAPDAIVPVIAAAPRKPPRPAGPQRPRLAMLVFLGVSFGLSWLLALPLWLGDGLASPLFTVVAVAIMFTPAIAALVVVLFVSRPAHPFRSLGLWPLTPAGRFIGYSALGLLVPIVLILVALVISSMLGLYTFDLVNFSGYQAMIDGQLAASGLDPATAGAMPPIQLLVGIQFVAVIFGGLINVIPALGEELGWRGWLFPQLMRLGTVPAILISGVIWGLWHAPLILLGYNYPDAPGWLGLLSMVGMCIVVGGVFAWLRMRSESVWPAALAHGSFNGAAGFMFVLAAAGSSIDTTQATILGWSGWIVPGILVAILVVTGQFKPRARPDTAAGSGAGAGAAASTELASGKDFSAG